MSILQTFSKSEDANMCAAYLASCGVDATVVDENGYGGNLLGSTVANAIRIEVPEDTLALARQHLAGYLAETTSQAAAEPASEGEQERHHRNLVPRRRV